MSIDKQTRRSKSNVNNQDEKNYEIKIVEKILLKAIFLKYKLMIFYLTTIIIRYMLVGFHQVELYVA